jgi:hypothetical protein
VLAIGTVTETAVSNTKVSRPRQTWQRQLVGFLELRHLVQPMPLLAWLVPGFTSCPKNGRLSQPACRKADRSRLGHHTRVNEASQARAPSGLMVISSTVSSMESTRQPSAKLWRSSSWRTRLGPQSPRCLSLKQSMK